MKRFALLVLPAFVLSVPIALAQQVGTQFIGEQYCGGPDPLGLHGNVLCPMFGAAYNSPQGKCDLPGIGLRSWERCTCDALPAPDSGLSGFPDRCDCPSGELTSQGTCADYDEDDDIDDDSGPPMDRCPEGALNTAPSSSSLPECLLDGNGDPQQCDTDAGYVLVEQSNGRKSCINIFDDVTDPDDTPPDCSVEDSVGMYLGEGGLCTSDPDTCQSSGGTYGHVGVGGDMNAVCISPDYADQLPSCSPGSYHVIDNVDGSNAFACSTPTDNPDGTNNDPNDNDGDGDGVCDPTLHFNCPNQQGHQDSDADGLPDTPDPCLGSSARECLYEPCAVNGVTSAQCNACVANPLGAACHVPCDEGFVSDGNQCLVDENADSGDSTAAGLVSFCRDNSDTALCQQQAGECDPTADDYLACLTAQAQLTDAVHTTTEFDDSVSALQEFNARIAASDIAQMAGSVSTAFAGSGAGECPVIAFEVYGQDITGDLHCTLYATVAPVISAVMYLVWSILGIRIFMEA